MGLTGHKDNRMAQFEKRLIIEFCQDNNIDCTETASTVIIKHNDRIVEAKPRTSMLTDKITNTSERYYNIIAKLRLVFNIYTQH